MEFRELSEEQWQFIQPLLPPGARTGRPRADDRRTLNGILYVLTTGCRWMDMPKEYGSHKTAWRRLKEWQERGVWEGLWQRLLELGLPGRAAGAGGGGCGCHHHRGQERGEAVGVDGFRRRKGSKVHALVAPPGLPLAVAIGPMGSHDATAFPQLMGGLRLGGRRGRPRRRPEELCADGAYDTREVRRHLRRRAVTASIPENPRGRRRPRRGRPYRFCGATYRVARAAVERFFAWLKGGFRRLALRYERLSSTFAALVYLACFLIAWRLLR